MGLSPAEAVSRYLEPLQKAISCFAPTVVKEIIGFHWHPLTTPEKGFPHLHVYEVGSDRLIHGRTHIPTGRITLEDVLRFAVRELGVEPQRKDWDEILTASQLAHEQHRSWGSSLGRTSPG